MSVIRRTPLPRPRRLLSDAQRLAWLRLIRSENVGPVTFREILNHFGGAETAIEALPELSRRGGRGRPIRIATRGEAERELASARRAGVLLAAIDEPGYPPLLGVIEAPPPMLYVAGRAEIVDRPMVAMVGARDASAAGRKLTAMIAADLAAAGLVIASGLARGIDAAAHQASLASGTVAVVAGGVDVVYPPENAGLHEAIARDGVIISENPLGLEPRGKDFPRRNRLISGMSYGVLVVEAARRSGSRITASFALEQGREVFAVPGHPLDPRAEGTNHLLKSGAALVTEAADVLAVLAPMLGAPPTVGAGAEPPAEPGRPGPAPVEIGEGDRGRVLEALGPAPIALDDLARATGLDVRRVRVALLELDLAGRIERSGGQLVALRV